ncbi:hypothetical protein EBI_25905 [Enterocytozoon bieneusi H348]|nr:hypothetical protein EBI_25905 [Enterocytozoon bieneusi H348]|eukprot:XP_002650954.1 hypothetical protein EBI_25905 [Enterocytozoon bieneusi H348]
MPKFIPKRGWGIKINSGALIFPVYPPPREKGGVPREF